MKKNRFYLGLVALSTLILSEVFSAPAPDRLNRGLIALPRSNGEIHLGWRLLLSDGPNEGFNIFRSTSKGGPYDGPLNATPVVNSTNFIDNTAAVGTKYFYVVKNAAAQTSNEAEVSAKAAGENYKFIRVQNMGSNSKIMRAIAADMTGDGTLDYLIMETDLNNPATPYLHCYDGVYGSFMWRIRLSPPPPNKAGGATNQWWTPVMAWDMDGNGKSEAYVLRCENVGDNGYDGGGVDTLVVYNENGQEIRRTLWVDRGESDWDTNFLGVGIWDGVPHVIGVRGTQYDVVKIIAWSGTLQQEWKFNQWGGDGGHYLEIVDIDQDGNDEILDGSFMLNSSGSKMWQVDAGTHVDICSAGDFDPNHAGMEVWFADCIAWCRTKGGTETYLVDAATGQGPSASPQGVRCIWGKDWDTHRNRPFGHLHGGYVADVDPTPGYEIITWDDYNAMPTGCGYPINQYPTSGIMRPQFVMDIKGNFLLYSEDYENYAFFNPVQFDDDDLWEMSQVYGDFRVYNFNGSTLMSFSNVEAFDGNQNTPYDIFGDFREETMVKAADESGIYVFTNTALSNRRKFCPLEDRGYRVGVSRLGSGYCRSTRPMGLDFSGNKITQPGDVDLTPPVMSTVKANDVSTVVISFSEAVEKVSTETAGNYSINNGIGVPAQAVASGAMVTLSLANPLTPNLSYEVTVNNVKDLNNNTIPANSKKTFPAPVLDVTPPAIVNVLASSPNLVVITFDEALNKISAETKVNYTLDQGMTIASATLDGTGKKVSLNLSTPLSEGTTYNLAIAGVQDLQGNSITIPLFANFVYSGQPVVVNITNLSPANYAVADLTAGITYYTDRGYTINTLPGSIATDAKIIKTANDDKNNCNLSYLSFDMSTSADVSIAWWKGQTLPGWIAASGFSLVPGEEIQTNHINGDPGTFELYQKSFSAGTVSLEGACSGGGNNYFVVIKGIGGVPLRRIFTIFNQDYLSVSPNPFQGFSTISYGLSEGSSRTHVRVSIADVQGKRVAMLTEQEQPSGSYSLVWNGRNSFGSEVTAGIYFVKLEYGGKSVQQKIVVLK